MYFNNTSLSFSYFVSCRVRLLTRSGALSESGGTRELSWFLVFKSCSGSLMTALSRRTQSLMSNVTKYMLAYFWAVGNCQAPGNNLPCRHKDVCHIRVYLTIKSITHLKKKGVLTACYGYSLRGSFSTWVRQMQILTFKHWANLSDINARVRQRTEGAERNCNPIGKKNNSIN